MQRVINLIDDARMINYGIWNTVIESKKIFQAADVSVELWYPGEFEGTQNIATKKLEATDYRSLGTMLPALDPEKDLIVSHGAWQYATRWGARLAAAGFRWVYVPHGMLEPWPMRHKWLKKK